MECPSQLSEFTSIVFVQLTGERDVVALRAEIEALKNGNVINKNK